MIPYVGGGVGIFQLTEHTPFSDEDDAVDGKHAGYRMSGGVEVLSGRVVSMALEGAYTRVPDSLGISGMSQVTGERDLGGFEFRMKLLFGR
jgi:opacity protein-like surface antigen